MNWLAICGVFSLATPAIADSTSQEASAYQELVRQDARLATIGYRLALANAPFCNKLERSLGWVLHDERQYPNPVAARISLEFRAPISVSAVVPNGPAERGGIKSGDGLLGLNGTYWSWEGEPVRSKSAKRLEKVQNELHQVLASSNAIDLNLMTAAGSKMLQVEPIAVCASRFWVDTSSKLDAGADGENVRISEGLMAFAAKDEELAAAIAHELAHNLLNHRNRLSKIGRKRAHILATEIEADQLSVWLMTNAGYDPAAALRFAERYGRKTGLGIFSESTHLRWKNRVKTMRTEIDILNTASKVNGLSPPPLLPGGSLATR
ncbi:M48 family metalloprotease [Sphingorhabdus sp.]|uniref:M48 family metalloprotease n=1 Tax=Sphingorhabdus sp. TaxID=1902408 RepID=UPI00359375F2